MGNKLNLFRMKPGMSSISRWFGDKYSYNKLLKQDYIITEYFENISRKMNIEFGDINIYTNNIKTEIVLHTAKPGSVYGKGSVNLELFRRALSSILNKPLDAIYITVENVHVPELDAVILGDRIAKDIQRRKSCHAIIRNYTQEAMRAGAIGVKIEIAGRINGAEISSRLAPPGSGPVPRNTIRANIKHSCTKARTNSGIIGVKVWINRPKNVSSNFLGIKKKESSNIKEEVVQSSEGAK